MKQLQPTRIRPSQRRERSLPARPRWSSSRALLLAGFFLLAAALEWGISSPAARAAAALYDVAPAAPADTISSPDPPRRLPLNRLRRAGIEPVALPPAALPPDSLMLPPAMLAAFIEEARAVPVVVASGEASYYGQRFAGRKTASGERFDPTELTAAHRTLPFGTRVRVTNLRNGRSVVVRINDRGPYAGKRVLDVSAAAAQELQMVRSGTAPVRIELVPGDEGSDRADR